MDECELIVFISTVACAISKCCSTDEITILSVVFTQLGDTLSTILTKRELSEKCTNNDEIKDSNDSINERD
jgi:dolichol kinase